MCRLVKAKYGLKTPSIGKNNDYFRTFENMYFFEVTLSPAVILRILDKFLCIFQDMCRICVRDMAMVHFSSMFKAMLMCPSMNIVNMCLTSIEFPGA